MFNQCLRPPPPLPPLRAVRWGTKWWCPWPCLQQTLYVHTLKHVAFFGKGFTGHAHCAFMTRDRTNLAMVFAARGIYCIGAAMLLARLSAARWVLVSGF